MAEKVVVGMSVGVDSSVAASVSYTHLDVYKRQDVIFAPSATIALNMIIGGLEDVYKRQDIRPVFPEERLLLEILLDKIPGTYEKDSVWNCSGNKYLINGKRIKFSVKELKNKDVDDIRSKYEEASKNISYEYFEQYADKLSLIHIYILLTQCYIISIDKHIN